MSICNLDLQPDYENIKFNRVRALILPILHKDLSLAFHSIYTLQSYRFNILHYLAAMMY